jgi:hypothetical protein
MGFMTLLDLAGSVVIGAFVVLMVLNLNDTAVENTYLYSGELTLQENLTETVQLLEYDFRKIGYCADPTQIADPTKSIVHADSASISFLTDVAEPGYPRGNGIVDTLTYFVGSVDELASTQNPRDRILYRRVNQGRAIGANLGLTNFRLKYLDGLGRPIATPVAVAGQIQAIQIDVAVENVMAYDKREKLDAADTTANYSVAMWRQIHLTARNLNSS